MMRLRWIGTVAAAVLGICQVISPSFASTMTWYLQDVTFDDGHTATGSFDYDATAQQYSNISISALNKTFDELSGFGNGPNVVAVTDMPLGTTLVLFFVSDLPALGGTVELTNSSFFQLREGFSSRTTSGAVLTATPLPATLPLIATGLGGLGLLGWRRKRKAKAT